MANRRAVGYLRIVFPDVFLYELLGSGVWFECAICEAKCMGLCAF